MKAPILPQQKSLVQKIVAGYVLMCDLLVVTQCCKIMFYKYCIQQDNDENSCGCVDRLRAIQRDVAEVKAVIAPAKTSGELEKVHMYHRSGTGGLCCI